MSDHDGRELERRIKHAQERKQKLMRTINAKAQALFDHEEKKVSKFKLFMEHVCLRNLKTNVFAIVQ